jgi:hypothetical protein
MNLREICRLWTEVFIATIVSFGVSRVKAQAYIANDLVIIFAQI